MFIHFNTLIQEWYGEEHQSLYVRTYLDLQANCLYLHVISEQDPETGDWRDLDILCRLARCHELDGDDDICPNILAYDAAELDDFIYAGEANEIRRRLVLITLGAPLVPVEHGPAQTKEEPEPQPHWQADGF